MSYLSSALRKSVQRRPEEEIDDHGDYEIILPPDPPVWGVRHIPIRHVSPHILRPSYAQEGKIVDESDRYHGDPYDGDGRIELGSKDEEQLRRASLLAKRTLVKASELVNVGVSTDEIDAALHDFITSNGAYPSPLKYAGFPKSCCTSVNNVAVHGIPDVRRLIDGDIVNIDITVYLDGFHGDTSQTFLVGEVDKIGRDLVAASTEALELGIRECRPGAPFRTIGAAIHSYAKSLNLSVSEQFTGHGIGKVFHRPPWILHHRNDEPGVMLPGHCFTIEPILIIGSDPRAWVFPDGWTASTMKGSRSTQAEHTVLITETGVDVLTR
ncbi:methionyl aminopeptidase [Fomitiporia mediterranea MF3/22]|uniref:methionyl aminopeptidase n=1 Tax=Fomitiporia mediterranea (strain MF3/22) TaxID=694068 RepID=UPI0004409C77|nr:methionyl aminopeptidase [Fomitiporia mediterranea MF3/22]EJD01707.1 methionyl aminopeptidase [Fomitiporia mediterranea MF3/22]